MSPMRVAYFTSLYPYASDTYVRNEIQALRQQGWEVLPFALRRPADGMLVAEELRQEADRTSYVLRSSVAQFCAAVLWMATTRPRAAWRAWRTMWRSHAAGVRNRMRQAAYLLEAAVLGRMLKGMGIRHVHNHIAENSATVAMLAAQIGGISYSITVHGPGIFYHPRQWGLGEKIWHSVFTVCISEFCRSQCMAIAEPQAWGRLQLIRCGLGENFLGASTHPQCASNHFVCVGRLCAEKGHRVLLEAVRRLVVRGLDVRVTIIGDGPMRAELERQVRDGKLAAQVTLLGWRSSDMVREQIQQSCALVLPSFAEGLPVVLMESLALGRPVITTWVAGIPELVEEGVNGWLVPPGSVEALAEAMENALNTPVETLTRMGLEGRAKVLRNHHASTEAAKLAGLFREALELNHEEPKNTRTHEGKTKDERPKTKEGVVGCGK